RLSEVCKTLRQRRESGSLFSIVVVSEDARPHPEEDFLTDAQRESIYNHERLGGIGPILAEMIQWVTSIDARATVLGYMQRGGSPTAFDRVLATRLGVRACEMAMAGEFGRMAAIQGQAVTSVSLAEATAGIKPVDPDLYRIAQVFAE
ncbi:MAG: 6-phosphofructokinase, partial [Blastocatellia bacterium]